MDLYRALRGRYQAFRWFPDGPIMLSEDPVQVLDGPIRLLEDTVRLSDGPIILADSQSTIPGFQRAL
jgi:hypothetical protein